MAKAIDKPFENSDAETKTETEGQFLAGFLALVGDLALILNSIGLAVAFTILPVSANTMSMSIRERRKEIAVLKTLGFSSALVLTLVLGEAIVIGAVGGAPRRRALEPCCCRRPARSRGSTASARRSCSRRRCCWRCSP